MIVAKIPCFFSTMIQMDYAHSYYCIDIIKKAMLVVDRWIEAGGVDARMVMQVHDELVFEVAGGEVEPVSREICRLMAGAAELAIPLLVEAGADPNAGAQARSIAMRELNAALTLDPSFVPVDHAVMGIVDDVRLDAPGVRLDRHRPDRIQPGVEGGPEAGELVEHESAPV